MRIFAANTINNGSAESARTAQSPIEVSSLTLFAHFPHFPQASRTVLD
jgi:hypothetical protein